MADRRAVRSSSRRITPTPQPPPAVSRRRGTRSASREVENVPSSKGPGRRGTRQASVASEGGKEEQSTRKATGSGQEHPVGDLIIVEEVESQLVIEDEPGTPLQPEKAVAVPHRSPGTVSEMSGTTAISSISQYEAADLESKFILRRISTLYRTSEEFLAHLVPDKGRIEDDAEHIREMLKPDSEFNEDFRFYERELDLQLSYYRSEHAQYINPRAVRRALLGNEGDLSEMQSPIDLLMYKANLLAFAKQGISLDRAKGDTWGFLQRHDKIFPAILLSGFTTQDDVTALGQGKSSLFTETFNLGLAIRTQWFIAAIERRSNEFSNPSFNPNKEFEDCFFQALDEDGRPVPHGWEVAGLGGSDIASPETINNSILDRVESLRSYFPMDEESLKEGEAVKFEDMAAEYPFQAFVLELLQWVRLRNREIEECIDSFGGIATISKMINAEVNHPEQFKPQPRAALAKSPRKKRVSFGKDRRRRSRNFDPNAPLDDRVVDVIKARERGQKSLVEAGSSHEIETTIEMEQNEPNPAQDEDEWRPVPNEGFVEPVEEDVENVPAASQVPRSTAEYLKAFNEGKKLDKENRGAFFMSQPDAQRVEFGDGFEEQSMPEPSNEDKGKQRQKPASRKRRQPDEDDDAEDEAFETEIRSDRAEERRRRAPITKRVRIDPASSAPPSHQPSARNLEIELIPEEPEEPEGSLSEPDAPDMTEEAPASSYAMTKQLAKRNTIPVSVSKGRKPRTGWTAEAEQALQEYMEKFPRQYAQILQHDQSAEGRGLLVDRSQVNLKDKARNMAINMIKSGAGLSPGFEDLIAPSSVHGKRLIADGFEW